MSIARYIVAGCVFSGGVIATFGAGAARSGGPSYTITDLGTLGGLSSAAFGINNLGQVVGGADLSDGKRHAFRWDSGVMTDLGVLPNDQYSEASGINNLGAICGYSSFSGTGLWDAFVWENGGMTRLPHLTGAQTGDTSAFAINDTGQVVGYSLAAPKESHPFLWESGVMTDIFTTYGVGGIAWDMNNAGQVVAGYSLLDLASGIATNLGTLGGKTTQALGLSSNGKVVGWSERVAGERIFHAFLWENGNIVDLIPGSATSRAEAVNSSGYVVGRAYGANGYGFLYIPVSGARDLVEFIPANSGWSDLSPQDMNDAGQIVGYGTIDGLPHAFLMTPVAIPATSVWGLLVLSLVILAAATIVLRSPHGSLNRR